MTNTMPLIVYLLASLSTLPCLIFSKTLPPRRNIGITGFTKLPLLNVGLGGTGSLTFDSFNKDPYTGTTDGRIVRYNKLTRTFEDFAYTSPNRTRAFCDGTTDIARFQICGFPKELSTDYLTREIYAVDFFLGRLTSVGPSGGLATLLAPTNGRPPYNQLLGVDAATNRKVYFTDGSSVYGPSEVDISIQTGDSTGKLLEYDTQSGVVTELLTQLGGPTGVATNFEASYVLLAEFNAKRIQKYNLKGEKAGTSEILLRSTGNLNSIKRIKGEENFWVANNISVNETFVVPQALKFSGRTGEILATLDLSPQYNQRVGVVLQQDDELFVGALNVPFIGKYKLVYF
ncbi:OLC1v1014011C1 [Oldenlandia corymbosa var. corymbosa]|uniref:OLC1v1014011C1 n=1 Tax=Oldenlandia corymbosa var. corymbosa TaxID=529605 RepID=A0AAV1E334_OLDCO|nr:OLC1v1014011C1 [Oldenlandia corymbosa var. corymbosa]